MRKTLDIIKVDLVTMNGGKNSMRTILLLMLIFFGTVGFLMPLDGVVCPLMTGAFFVPMMFQNEQKYHSEKLYGLLPINRRDLVNARFLLAIGVNTATFVFFYLLMLLAQHLKLMYLILEEDAELFDTIAFLAKMSGNGFTEYGLFNLLYFTAYAFGLITCTSSLRKAFKNSEAFSGTLTFGTNKEVRRQELTAAAIVFGVMLIAVLAIADILPIIPLLLPILAALLQLAQAADGVLLSAVMVAAAAFTVIYKYICTVLEYDDKDL